LPPEIALFRLGSLETIEFTNFDSESSVLKRMYPVQSFRMNALQKWPGWFAFSLTVAEAFSQFAGWKNRSCL